MLSPLVSVLTEASRALSDYAQDQCSKTTAYEILMGLSKALGFAAEEMDNRDRKHTQETEKIAGPMFQNKWEDLITYRSPRELISFISDDAEIRGLISFLELCEISGGADVLNGMPRTLTLKHVTILESGVPAVTQRYVQVTDELLLLAKRLAELAKTDGSLRAQEHTGPNSNQSFNGHLQRLLVIKTEVREENDGEQGSELSEGDSQESHSS